MSDGKIHSVGIVYDQIVPLINEGMLEVCE